MNEEENKKGVAEFMDEVIGNPKGLMIGTGALILIMLRIADGKSGEFGSLFGALEGAFASAFFGVVAFVIVIVLGGAVYLKGCSLVKAGKLQWLWNTAVWVALLGVLAFLLNH